MKVLMNEPVAFGGVHLIAAVGASLVLTVGAAGGSAVSPRGEHTDAPPGRIEAAEPGPHPTDWNSPLAPASITVEACVPGALYGTNGSHLYIIDTATAAATLIGPHLGVIIGGLSFDVDGVLYGLQHPPVNLFTIDPTTGEATSVGPIGLGDGFEGGLAVRNGVLYAADLGNSSDAKTFTINKSTGRGTLLGPPFVQMRDIDGMAFDGDTLLAIDRVSNTLGFIDWMGSSGFPGAYYQIGQPMPTIGDIGGLAVDPQTRTIYAAFGGTGGLYRLDRLTAFATLIGVNRVDWGLAFCPCPPDCPVCGNGRIEAGEECDDSNPDPADLCAADCSLTYCGDGVVQTPNGRGGGGPLDDGFEQCDDGNAIPDDGCSNCEVVCNLVGVALTPPIDRSPPWVYTNDCGPGGQRIDNSVTVISAPPASSIDTGEPTAPGVPGTLTLYQLDCGCSLVIRLLKSGPTIRLYL